MDLSKKAIIFPGQGAQYPQMGLSLYKNFPEAKKVFDLVDQVSEIKVSQAIFNEDSSKLKDTSIQQLAILAVSLAAYKQAKSSLDNIEFVSGLSLGEYSCLYAGGVLSLEDVIILVKTRAQAMQRAATKNPSSMLAIIGTEPKDLEPESRSLKFYIANINAPSQVVISVSNQDKENIKSNLEKKGLRVIELSVSGGFHSPFMESARDELREVVNQLQFSDAKIPIVSNVTATEHIKSEQIKENLIKQLVNPVLWMDSVKYLSEKNVNCFYEVGPGKILKGILRKIDRDLKVVNIEKKEDLDKLNFKS
ncbi:MAG: ACP S-malonyltransferase [Candidatus Omnitrophica bacterium]|nr:ACP S-malonyltransferase [Candidatus Omnitrophota bacterium]MCF7893564.1 ACP S-malonyltransferase [Candidatus Omnitrophota bacterium]